MRLLIAALLAAASLAQAAQGPYNESADAKADIREALTNAKTEHRAVLVVFGANWCPDCRALDLAMNKGHNGELIAKEFEVVKVDVGRFDHNVDLAASYEVPLKKGIPAVAIVSPDGNVVYATRGGELADARRMSEDGLYRFFREAADRARLR